MAVLVSPIIDHSGATNPSNEAVVVPTTDIDSSSTHVVTTPIIVAQNAILDLAGTGYAL